MTRLATKATPHVSWRRTTLGGVAAVTLFAVGVVSFMGMRAAGIGAAGSLLARGELSARDQIIVADFRAPDADSSLGVVVGEAVRVGLGESRAVRVMPASQVAAALGRMQRGDAGRLDHALARELAQREGAKAVVDGDVTLLGQGFIVSVRLRDAASDDELASFRETADSPSELIPAIDRATRALRGKIGESLKGVRATPSLAQVTTASLPALRKYSEAFRAHVRLDYATAIPAYEEAIRLDSMFAYAHRQLAIVYGNQRARPDRIAVLATRAYELRDRLPEIERLLVEATYHGPLSPAADRGRVAAAYERVLQIDPENASALNNLGVLLEQRRELTRAESLLANGRRLYPDITFFWSGLVRLQLRQGRTEDAIRSFGEYRQRFPEAADLSNESFRIAHRRFGIDSLIAACQRAERSRAETARRRGVDCLRNFALVRGQLAEHARLAARSATLERDAGNEWTRIGALDSAFVDIWYRGRPADALSRLDQYVARMPRLDGPRSVFSLYFRIANLYAWAGRPDRARAILNRHAAEVRDTARLRIEGTLRTRAEGEVALAERRYDDAIRLFQKGDTLYDGAPSPCELCALGSVARAHDLAGHRDAAIAAFERYVEHPWREGEDAQYLAGAHKRLAELHDAAGNAVQAASHYAAFVDLWKDADPELQPKVAAARKRLAELTAREGRLGSEPP